MQKNIWIILAVSFLFACTNNGAGKKDTEQKKEVPPAAAAGQKSIPSEISKRVGNTTIKIAYTAPAVRGRVIWGKLVPYDKIWVTGAHNATSLEIGEDFRVGNKTIPAGKYALFTIPGKEQWTVILNKNWNQHQADDYKESDDMVRLKVEPKITEQVVERLKFEIDQTGERTANVIMSWEKIRVPFSIEIL
ncbi:DUF2911 domain-containing protein [Chitinophagaceae bacterium LB-8]|uniref:DUF2911 domain-containing protein n=1 Tax=Paraflavisolibacter caeni TaxID=2982496 RepID=A0A9X2XP06_9BACT|nr:DUF2911 domain-containing protein [Paraflavisolibacter caeni]MCU7550123.1 DUF2911 domain-containing protein [Paraflavisolibacter caeni]